MVERLDYKRAGLALIAVAALVMAMVAITAGAPAYADHIPETGTLPDNCVEFQAGNTGTESPPDYPDVDITLDEWSDSSGDPHTVDFTISGLAVGEYVDISTKSGNNDPEETGPYGNGSHSFHSDLQQAISHIRLCVFEDPVETTTTTVQETTTTVPEETTTTAAEETTTTVEETTTTVEILETTLTTTAETTTSSIEDTVLGTEVLPFTGVESEWTFWLATILALTGGLLVYGAKRAED